MKLKKELVTYKKGRPELETRAGLIFSCEQLMPNLQALCSVPPQFHQ